MDGSPRSEGVPSPLLSRPTFGPNLKSFVAPGGLGRGPTGRKRPDLGAPLSPRIARGALAPSLGTFVPAEGAKATSCSQVYDQRRARYVRVRGRRARRLWPIYHFTRKVQIVTSSFLVAKLPF